MRDEQFIDSARDLSVATDADRGRHGHLAVVPGGRSRAGEPWTRRRNERRASAPHGRARAAERSHDYSTEWQFGEPPADLAGHELCSVHFVSGAGWAWRLTAALSRSREATDVIPHVPRAHG